MWPQQLVFPHVHPGNPADRYFFTISRSSQYKNDHANPQQQHTYLPQRRLHLPHGQKLTRYASWSPIHASLHPCFILPFPCFLATPSLLYQPPPFTTILSSPVFPSPFLHYLPSPQLTLHPPFSFTTPASLTHKACHPPQPASPGSR